MLRSALLLLRHRGGATAIEYALIASILSIAIVSSLTAVSSSLDALWVEISSAFNTPV